MYAKSFGTVKPKQVVPTRDLDGLVESDRHEAEKGPQEKAEPGAHGLILPKPAGNDKPEARPWPLWQTVRFPGNFYPGMILPRQTPGVHLIRAAGLILGRQPAGVEFYKFPLT
jgi:hypothetical protein